MNHPARSIRHALASLAFFCLPGLSQAGSVLVSVTDAEGKPAPDVVVLISTSAKAPVVPAAAPVVISQQDLRFIPFLTVVPVGTTLRFINRDGFDHHVRSTATGPLGNVPAAVSFEFRLDAAATKRGDAPAADVRLDAAGPIGLGCHLHSSMRGQVYATNTPWFGKTDANGVVTIEGVPDGAADVSFWHGDQLQAQPTQRLQVTGAQAKASAQLNFTPRRRRGG
jgi:plastocyanin